MKSVLNPSSLASFTWPCAYTFPPCLAKEEEISPIFRLPGVPGKETVQSPSLPQAWEDTRFSSSPLVWSSGEWSSCLPHPPVSPPLPSFGPSPLHTLDVPKSLPILFSSYIQCPGMPSHWRFIMDVMSPREMQQTRTPRCRDHAKHRMSCEVIGEAITPTLEQGKLPREGSS